MSQAASNQPPAPLAVGQIVDSVICIGDPSESYALYLPSAYTSAKRWPIIYAFDPLARGKIPVKLYKDAAEKYGYIVAGSNNSRNFALEESSKSANAIWQDTHARLSLDERQTYTTGFSGGARIAGLVALRCTQCKIAGVIAHGAGYPDTGQPRQKDDFLYFLAVGNQDFNWGEIVTIRREREEMGSPYRARVFPGEHQWAPPAVIEDAVEWIHLKAMQASIQPKDAAFIDRFFGRMQDEARAAEQQKNAIEQLSAYRSLLSDFAGLKDVTEYKTKLEALQKSDELKKAQKREKDAIAEQQSLASDVSAKMADLAEATSDQRMDLRQRVLDGMSQLKGQAEHLKDPDQRLIRLRAFSDLWAQGIEAGQAEFARKHFASAEYYFRLMADVSPDEPWPVLLLAETHTAMGNKKQAIKDVREVVRRGVKNPDVLEKDQALEPLRSEPEYRQIVEQMKKK
jgi:dienelactone hydrolase